MAKRYDDLLVIRTGGPNAGHTCLNDQGEVFKLRQLPTAIISNPDAQCAIAAGSLINPQVLKDELAATQPKRPILIDGAATILQDHHIKAETDDETLLNWSTRKGIGAARADRIKRQAMTAAQWWDDWQPADAEMVTGLGDLAMRHLYNGGNVLVEAAQGYGLGLHTSFYPKTTSADCRAIDALADAGISPWCDGIVDLQVWVVIRPYPIRVAGESGPLENETSWEELGLEPEYTTVTNKVRRVGHWDHELVVEAVRANGGISQYSSVVRLAFTMMDQVVPEVRGMTQWHQVNELPQQQFQQVMHWIDRAEATGAAISAIGTGPDSMIMLTPDDRHW